jgi:hypothetical protein
LEQSDKYLIEFLSKCSNVELHILLQMLRSRFSPASKKLLKHYPNEHDIPDAGSQGHPELAEETTNLLRWYGSNAFAYVYRRITHKNGGTNYHKILRDTAKVLNKFRKRKDRMQLPRVASVEEWEDLICALLLKDACKKKTPEQITTMFKQAGLEEEAAKHAAKQFGPGTTSIALPLLVKILGKKTTKAIIKEVIVKITQRRLGKNAALQLAKRLLIKVPQKTIARTLSIVGWVLFALDAVCFLASPARRITIRTVALISGLQTRERVHNL